MITLKELKGELWAAADMLRDVSSFSDSINYLLRLLLLKRLSDVFEEKAEAIERETGDRDQAWNKPDKHHFFIPEGSRWDDLRRLNRNICDGFNKAVTAIESANPKLKEIFVISNLNGWERIGGEILLRLILHFSSLNLRNSNLAEPDLLGDACEDLIERFAVKDSGIGEYTTPPTVVELLVRLIAPQEGMSICDPVCGLGRLLIECTSQIERQGGNRQKVSLYGQEINREAWAIARINLLLHGIFNFELHYGDTFTEPQLLQDGKLMCFDRVIANPPFGLHWRVDEIAKADKYYRFRYGIPPKSTADFAFIQHILATLNNDGLAGVTTTHGVLFRGGSEGTIRENLIKADLIEAVISLPSNLFYNTGIPSVLLIFNRNKLKNRRDKILFIDATNEYQKNRGQNYLRDEDITHIVTAYQSFGDEEEYAKVIALEELAENNYLLNVSRYVLPRQPEIDIEAEINKLHKLETERAEAEKKVNEYLRALGVKV